MQRSYSSELFVKAVQCMQKANIKISSELARFENLKTRVDDVIAQRQEEEEDMDDIPDEFMGWSPEAKRTVTLVFTQAIPSLQIRSCRRA